MEMRELFNTVLQNSERVTIAIEQTKNSIAQSAEANIRVAAAIEKNSETNSKQTEAISLFLRDRDKLEKDKTDIDAKYAAQLEAFKKAAEDERKKYVKYIIILLALLFIAVGGAAVLSKAQEIGLFKLFTGA